MSVYAAKDEEGYGDKRVYTQSNRPIVELEMSSAQFAELLTTMNMGQGVPCTLKYADGKQVDQTPLMAEDKPIDIGKKFFEKNAKEFSDKISTVTKQLSEELEDIKMSKKSKDKVNNILTKVRQEVCANMPFYVEIFEETAEKVISESKAEIDAFVTSGIVRAGLDALGIDGKNLIESTNENRMD